VALDTVSVAFVAVGGIFHFSVTELEKAVRQMAALSTSNETYAGEDVLPPHASGKTARAIVAANAAILPLYFIVIVPFL
jgi:hypothetical protein